MGTSNEAVSVNITIASGATTSSALTLPATFYLAGIMKDTTLDTSTAVTFTVSMDGVTYYTLMDTAGAAISYTVAAAGAEAMTFPPTQFFPWEYVKFVVADAQTGITTIQCIVRQY
jgi:hypothetical protein